MTVLMARYQLTQAELERVKVPPVPQIVNQLKQELTAKLAGVIDSRPRAVELKEKVNGKLISLELRYGFLNYADAGVDELVYHSGIVAAAALAANKAIGQEVTIGVLSAARTYRRISESWWIRVK